MALDVGDSLISLSSKPHCVTALLPQRDRLTIRQDPDPMSPPPFPLSPRSVRRKPVVTGASATDSTAFVQCHLSNKSGRISPQYSFAVQRVVAETVGV